MTIARTVRISDVCTPSTTGGRNMLSNMKRHWNALFVTSMWTNIADRIAMTTMATQRPGWRTGTAVTASGRARSAVFVSVMTPRAGTRTSGVDGRGVDGPRVNAPLGQDRLVGPVGDERGARAGERIGAVGLLHRVGGPRGVGEHGVVLARDHRGGCLVLPLVPVDGDGRLPGALARLDTLGQVVGVLDGVGLDGDLLAAGVVGLDPVRVARLGPPLGARAEVADHVDLLLALVVDGERRDADLVLPGLDAREDRVEHG